MAAAFFVKYASLYPLGYIAILSAENVGGIGEIIALQVASTDSYACSGNTILQCAQKCNEKLRLRKGGG